MAAIDIDSKALSISAEISTCVDHTLGDANFTGTATTIDAIDRFVPLTTEDTPSIMPVSNEDLEKVATVATMGDCKTSEDASYPVSSNRKHIFSVLHSILGVYTVSIPITILRRFATSIVHKIYEAILMVVQNIRIYFTSTGITGCRDAPGFG